jgi:putative peptidoglycan lipid II flippase
VELIAADLSAFVSIALANGRGTTGALVLYNYAYLVFSSIYSALAISIVLSAFPVLSARDGQEFDRTCAGSTRAVVLANSLGMAVTAAVAIPAAHVLAEQSSQVPQLIWGFVLFAPGLVGIGVIANLSRAMLAIGRLKVAAVAVAGSWLLVMLAQVALVELLPGRLTVAALALGNSIGQTVAAIPLVIVARRIRGKAAVHKVGRALLAGSAAAAAGAVAGLGASIALPTNDKLPAIGTGTLAVSCAVLVFGGVAFLLDPGDMRAVLARLRQIARLRPAAADES